ncbi:sugar transporter [Ilyonectria robusta]|uniref:sugar transporter n=1 Tax=Ilyonectria robusta TaxID=1079257 RepID=UPI001E8DE043|nr:sugar transporter [Ilyonectria robusta]KAH8721814.1 sugar transporter [Ilyonectria robusta]
MSAQPEEVKVAPSGDVVQHVESGHKSSDAPIKTAAPVLKSTNDELSMWDTAVLICNMMCIAAAADGYQINLNGGIIANQGFTNHVGFRNEAGVYTLRAENTALWGAMQSLGQLIGQVLLNPISDRLGRKRTLYCLWIILAGSLIIETLVRDWRDWAGAKVLAGVGVGAIQATLPIYVYEWSPVNIRGAMVVTYGFWNTIGKFLANLVLMVCQQTDPLDYKVPILTQWGFLGVMLPVFLWLPETAAYFAAKGRDEDGKATLRRVNGSVQGYDVEVEYAIIKNTILEERRQQLEENGDTSGQGFKEVLDSYVECFRGTNFRRTIGAALPSCSQQLSGLSFLNVYASLFFKQSGFTNAFLITTIQCCIQLFAAFCLMLGSDKIGRRLLVLIAMGFCMGALLVVGILGLVPRTQALMNFLIFVACVWSFFNSIVGSLGGAFSGEVGAQRLRARTAGIAQGLAVIFGLIFNTTVPLMLDVNGANWGYKTAWLFFGTGSAVCVVLWFMLPECARRNAAEIDEMYEKGVLPRKMGKYVTEAQLMNVGVVGQ